MMKGLENILNNNHSKQLFNSFKNINAPKNSNNFKKKIDANVKKGFSQLILSSFLFFSLNPFMAPKVYSQQYKTAIPQNRDIFNLYVQEEFLRKKIEAKYDSIFTLGAGYEILWNATEEEEARDKSEYIRVRNKVGYNPDKNELIFVSGVAKKDIFKPYTHGDSYIIVIGNYTTKPSSKQSALIYDAGNNLVEEWVLDDEDVCVGPYCETLLKTADDIVFEVAKKIGLGKKQLTGLLELLNFDEFQKINAEKEKIKIMQMLKMHDATVYYFYGKNPPVDLFHLNRELAHKTVIKLKEIPYAMIIVSSIGKQVGLIEFFTSNKKEKDWIIGEVKSIYLINNIFPNKLK